MKNKELFYTWHEKDIYHVVVIFNMPMQWRPRIIFSTNLQISVLYGADNPPTDTVFASALYIIFIEVSSPIILGVVCGCHILLLRMGDYVPRHIMALWKQRKPSLIARFMEPPWDPSGTDRTQVGPMLVPWTLLSGITRLFSKAGSYANDSICQSNRVDSVLGIAHYLRLMAINSV